ncbi:APC family permease [Anaerovorax odorimutans]|uniref:APC family permease n=1 Tax=Anaerovorax odorimutans TaxID=109327 RepID=A0ABT1RKK1_9FIRM|nr:APC family permease [Anaerovorax odorimutans]MCQ4635486.1 APC family permease [Anaerovorax odorimutans]
MSEQKSTAAMDVGEHGLKKHDIKVSTVVFMIFCLVAAGCYGIEEMIPECGPGLTIVMLCVLPFVWGLPFGLVASELGSVRPQEGGYYKWVQEALGEFWGFQAGWWRTISIYIDNTSYVILAGGYAATVWDMTWTTEFALKFGMILIFTLINIRGVKDVGIASTILSILVMVAFGVVAICGFINWGGDAETASTISFQMTAEPAEGLGDWFFYIAGGISIGMWMYSGYESMSTIAGEVSNPQVIPKGTLITIPLIMAVYILPTTAGLGSLGNWENWGTEGDAVGYAEVVAHFWGPVFGVIFAIVAILAQCSIYNTYIASGSRGFFALADDYLAPPVMVKCDKKYGVPYVAVLSVGIFNLIFCMFPFGFIIILDVALLMASYILVYISAMVLRRRIPKEEYVFRIPGGNGLLALICIVPICVAIFANFVNGSDYYLGGMIGIITGPILYFIWRRRYGGLTRKDPERYPKNEKTGLAVGDTRKIAFLFLVMSIMNGIALLFEPWYEGWGTEDAWESGDYFDGVLEGADVNAIVGTIQVGLGILTAVCAVACIVFFILSKKVEPQKEN